MCSNITMVDYPSRIVELKPMTAPARSLTRSHLSEEGISMSTTVMPGDFVCCEIDAQQEPWMIGKAETRVITYDGPEQQTWMGKIIAGEYHPDGIKGPQNRVVFGTNKRGFCACQMSPGRAFGGLFCAGFLISEGCGSHGFRGTLGI